MGWLDSLMPFLVGGSATGLVLGLVNAIAKVYLRLHADAVAAEQRRADDHRAAAEAWKAIAMEREKQRDILLGGRERP